MAITSTFYDTSAGTPASLVTEVKWAKAHPFIGSSNYGVVGPNDFKVTAHPSTATALNVATGRAWGHGVLDESTTVVTVVGSAPPAGTSRWDLVCIRRNWTLGAGGPSTIEIVEGGTTKAIPAGRNKNPGTIDDQPLALVQWTAGQTQPTSIVDLRCWAGNGGMTAVDDLALGYLDIPGASVLINGALWNHSISTSGTTSWSKATVFGRVPLFGAASPLSGALTMSGMPGGFTDFLIQAGTTVNHYDQSCYARITWPNQFPNGLLTVIGMDGDDWATGGSHTIASAGSIWGSEGFGNKTSWVYAGRAQPASPHGYNGDPHTLVYARGFMAGRIHRINWIAIGF